MYYIYLQIINEYLIVNISIKVSHRYDTVILLSLLCFGVLGASVFGY